MTPEEKIMQLSVGKVVKWNRSKYPNHVLYVHIIGFVTCSGWTLSTGVIVNNHGSQLSAPVPSEELEL